MKKTLPEIKRILSIKDLIAKIVCVLLAILLWVYIGNTNIGETQFKIPVIFTELPDTLVKSKISSRYVTIKLSGKKDLLKNINIKNIKALIDLNHPKIGKHEYPVEINKDELPDNIDVKVSNKVIAVTIEKKLFKKVKVKLNIIDKVTEGYVLGKIRIIPDTITLSGPESLVKDIDFVKTTDISIANKTGRIVREVPVDKSEMKNTSLDVTKVKVIIPVIESANLFKYKKEISLINTSDKYKYILSNEEINVFLQTENPQVELYKEDIQAFIDAGKINIDEMFKAANKDSIEWNFTVDILVNKEGIRIISIVPDIITIKIIKKDIDR